MHGVFTMNLLLCKILFFFFFQFGHGNRAQDAGVWHDCQTQSPDPRSGSHVRPKHGRHTQVSKVRLGRKTQVSWVWLDPPDQRDMGLAWLPDSTILGVA
jgi:hypothetical protein